jgi:hypothetical protein
LSQFSSSSSSSSSPSKQQLLQTKSRNVHSPKGSVSCTKMTEEAQKLQTAQIYDKTSTQQPSLTITLNRSSNQSQNPFLKKLSKPTKSSSKNWTGRKRSFEYRQFWNTVNPLNSRTPKMSERVSCY